MLQKNQVFQASFEEDGHLSKLVISNDENQMNWVIDEDYLENLGYAGKEKLFGNFDFRIGDKVFNSTEVKPKIDNTNYKTSISYEFEEVTVIVTYNFIHSDQIEWTIEMHNHSMKELVIDDLGVWISLAYVMFRDKDVLKNINNSAAIFSSISTNYTKINAVRRNNLGSNLGIYQTNGKSLSVGTYCEYENLFFESVSPSLDGLLFHKLILAGGYPENFENRDWIYSKESIVLPSDDKQIWSYILKPNFSQEDFYQQAFEIGHPKINFEPLNVLGEKSQLKMELPLNKQVKKVHCIVKKDVLAVTDLTDSLEKDGQQYYLSFTPSCLGEHKIVFYFTDGSEDFIVMNVMDKLSKVIEERVDCICSTLYNGEDAQVPYAFEPISNQGESLGKLNLVLKKNILGQLAEDQVHKVEESAVKYVRQKWFIDGDFTKPRKLYGDFYRSMDFEYISHLFLLLSEFDDSVLQIHQSSTYLKWAADVFNLRVNPNLHENERGKEEAQMLGVYFLYIQNLLEKLKNSELQDTYQTIKVLWEQVTMRVNSRSETYSSAITEHFYDNAGFGPTAGSLSGMGMTEGANRYGQLLLANIGYSNDFRGQNPDRWWEALTYMIHSLWGGITAAAAYKVYDFFKDTNYLEASYRATAGILYCYDTHSTTTLPLEKGMAASTYAVAGPHMNRYDLSRERFGQATFFKDGGIFSRLFENDSQTPDWDMGEELVAYLDSFGQKTFILKEKNNYRVINGALEELDNQVKVTSYAPYCNEFIMIEGKYQKSFIADENNVIILDKNSCFD